MPDRNYGKTRHGVPITEELVAKLAEEAEAGFDVDQMLRRRRGRPPMGTAAAGVESVRLDPELRAAVLDRAERESSTVSSLIREALRLYLLLDVERRRSDRPGPSSATFGSASAASRLVSAGPSRPHLQLLVSPGVGLTEVQKSQRVSVDESRIVLHPQPGLTKRSGDQLNIPSSLEAWRRLRLGA